MVDNAHSGNTMHILIAVDGSPSSVQARDLVASLAWPANTSVTLLSAYRVPTGWLVDPQAASVWLPDAEEDLERDAEKALDELAAPLEGHGWNIDRRHLRGRAAGAVL